MRICIRAVLFAPLTVCSLIGYLFSKCRSIHPMGITLHLLLTFWFILSSKDNMRRYFENNLKYEQCYFRGCNSHTVRLRQVNELEAGDSQIEHTWGPTWHPELPGGTSPLNKCIEIFRKSIILNMFLYLEAVPLDG